MKISKYKRILSGTLSVLMMGQILIYGDGVSQGIAHAETIDSIKNAIAFEKTQAELAKEFDEAVDGLGDIDYFGVSDFSMMRSAASDEINLLSLDLEDVDVGAVSTLTVSGSVQKGTVSGHAASDNTPIYVRIFDGDWNELTSQEISDGGSYSVTAGSKEVYHVKFECDGYLPFYLKDFGTGSYQIGSGNSWDTITLIPGDTTYNEWEDNAWSDDVLNANDAAYVQSCLGAYRGDSDFNPSMDLDGDGVVSQAELDTFCELYTELGEDDRVFE